MGKIWYFRKLLFWILTTNSAMWSEGLRVYFNNEVYENSKKDEINPIEGVEKGVLRAKNPSMHSFHLTHLHSMAIAKYFYSRHCTVFVL